MKGIQRTATVAGVIALAMSFGACDGGGSSCSENPSGPSCRPSPSPSPVTVTETVVIYGDSGGVPPDSAIAIDFGIPSAGTVAATVDWTFASSEVWVSMTAPTCNDFVQAFLGQCSQIGTPNLGNLKPKTVTGSVTQGGPGRLWIANFATVNESMAIQITLTTTRSASAPIILEPFAHNWVVVPNASARALRAFEN